MKLYDNHYTKFHFERAGLFKTIRDAYQCRDILYPGCSVHITPSLYFLHVVYVDQGEAAAQFFANETSLLEFINHNKHYKQSPYIRFIQQDYYQSLPLMEGKFDLLISLFAGGVAKSCATYLKPGGLLLTNNHQDDAMDALKDGDFEQIATVQFQKGSYSVSEDIKGTKLPSQKLNKYLKQVNDSVQYVENETYYVFERLHEARKQESKK